MFTVVTSTGAIVARSRLREVALGYLADGMTLLVNGVPA